MVHLQIDFQVFLCPGLYRQSISHNRGTQKFVNSVIDPLQFLLLNRFCQNCIKHFIRDSNWPSNNHLPLGTFCHTASVNTGVQQRMKTESLDVAGRELPISLIYLMESQNSPHLPQVFKIKYYCSRLYAIFRCWSL